MKIFFSEPQDNIHPFELRLDNPSVMTLIAGAKEELEVKVHELADEHSATWGFFPELKPDASEYTACVALKQHFDTNFLKLPDLQRFDLQLAFIRLAIREPKSAFGGLHVDTSAGIDHLSPKERSNEHDGIIRVLVNLYEEPRKLEYCPETIEFLRARNIVIPKDRYKIITLPEDIPLKSYAVKPLEHNRIHGIMFDSSSVLHAGRTDEKGHFLLSYGGYAQRETVRKLV